MNSFGVVHYRKSRAFLIGIVVWGLVFILALKLGAVSDAPIELISQIRLPRVLLASLVGMGLAVVGTALQALFANPLCEPYTLGISSGSALGAVLGVSLGLEWTVAGLTGTAFLGALLFAAILYGVSSRLSSNNTTLLLTGVMLGFLGTSLVAIWMAMTDVNGLQSAMGWLFGDLSRARMKGVTVSAGFLLALIFLLWRNWRELDGLLMGEEGAYSLGVDVPRVRRRIILLSSLIVGICVSAGGMIGFVGLVVPHFVRRQVGALHFALIPLAAIWGAIALTLADCGARYLVRPNELPVGVVTALLGAPVFLAILLRRETS